MPQPVLNILTVIQTPALQEACLQWLKGGRYHLLQADPATEPLVQLEQRCEDVDGLLLEEGAVGKRFFSTLHERGLELPAVLIGPVTGDVLFHGAEVRLPPDQLEQLSYSLDAAVSRFLRSHTPPASSEAQATTPDGWKLSNRLNGRLGYLSVYYKRDPSRFLRNLEAEERRELLDSLRRSYRDLLISYFKNPATANQAIESFVNTAFFADLPITKMVEIHVNLIEEFWKQLMLKGQKNDFLQDYRLALLDVMAHLCEMYRRSIPPDVPILTAPMPEVASPIA
ncbi:MULTISPECIES: circadian clock protein KaiA [unclassified Cyanobium]|uniref:circadian clock protein KaiA n=1 Tax=unclassified Cyanobium TaxID=2627006 RepID=UPI0020CFB1DA|nr:MULTISPECIES: circadian clock protein KaiA [unclassified Cyanobium]MCP9833468.1 circadian clock protein KaiA [Cyanobium sp. La Preciosa 7G6]MCP9936233.1 circadian clock protein KaiA [Cyanobium sp. Aljojuca 7A6]